MRVIPGAAPLALAPVARTTRVPRARRIARRATTSPALGAATSVDVNASTTPDATATSTAAPSAMAQAAAMFESDDNLQPLVRLPAFRLPASRAAIVIVNVPVPDAFDSDSLDGRTAVAYRASSGMSARVLGRTLGMVAPGTRVVRTTVSVKRMTAAGANSAASVEFRDSRGRRYLVPVELEVAADRAVAFTVDNDYMSAARGAWTGIGFSVLNNGNGPETLTLHAELPQGWRSQVAGASLERGIEAGATVRGMVRLWIPAQFSAGQARAMLVLRRGTEVVASRTVFVSVDDSHGQTRRGPGVGLSMAAATGADGSTATGYALTMDGQLADSVSISARATFSSNGVGAAGYGLARAGVASGPPVVSLRSPRVGVSAGAIGVQRSELSGYFVNGLGATGDVKVGKATVSAFAAKPFGFAAHQMFSAGAGRLLGLSVSRPGGRLGTLTAQGISMRDDQGGRDLTAVTLESRIASFAGGELVSELGWRAFAGGGGAGAALGYRRTTGGSLLDVRAVHAPGGNRAYGRATDDLSAMLSRRLSSNAQVAAGLWHQSDAGASLGAYRATGWFVTPTLDLPRLHSSVGVELRSNGYRVQSVAGRFTDGERQATAMFDTRYRAGYLTVRAGAARMARGIDYIDVNIPAQSGVRTDVRTALGVGTLNGRYELTHVAQRFTGGASFYPAQQSLGARMDGLRVPRIARGALTLDADVQRLVIGATTAANWSARGGITAALPGRLGQASMQAEYNPYLLSALGGRSGVLYTLRLTRGFNLPRLAGPHTQRVFVDENGNGRRDASERGAAGVALQCGDALVMSDADGRFACPAGRMAMVDARTLPAGVAGPAGGMGARADGDVALRPMAVRLVRLTVASEDSLQVGAGDLGDVLVIARDSSGATFVARSVGQGLFSFDALPIGRYEIEVDASAVSEPLRAMPEKSVLLIRPDVRAEVIEIAMKPRAMRVKQIGSRRAPTRDVPGRQSSGAVGTPAIIQQDPQSRQRQ